eukprot:2402346-Pyramimonas_sp.AAC.1
MSKAANLVSASHARSACCSLAPARSFVHRSREPRFVTLHSQPKFGSILLGSLHRAPNLARVGVHRPRPLNC